MSTGRGQTARRRASSAFGTVDSFLHLAPDRTGRATRPTRPMPARTNLFNIRDTGLGRQSCSRCLACQRSGLPDVRDCVDDFGTCSLLGEGHPDFAASRGISKPRRSGRLVSTPGDIKSTYGTGCFVILNTGRSCVTSDNRAAVDDLPTGLDGKVTYALEGSIFIAGAAVQWLRDESAADRPRQRTEKHL